MKKKSTISAQTREHVCKMSETHSIAILSIPQFGDIINKNSPISFRMIYEDSCFLQPLFFLRLGKSDAVCSSLSSRLWFLMASGRRWLAIPPACCRGGEGRERLFGAQHYISGSAGASRRSVCRRHPKPEPDPEPWDVFSSRILKSSSAPGPVGLRKVYFSRKRKKSGEMNSAYQHLISLLFVFSSLHVNHLTEGCSCALAHPQDAFCNSDIGE